jgi:hypothetical protein
METLAIVLALGVVALYVLAAFAFMIFCVVGKS